MAFFREKNRRFFWPPLISQHNCAHPLKRVLIINVLRIWRKYVKSVNLTLKVSVFKPINFKLKSGVFVRFYRVIYGCFTEFIYVYIIVCFLLLVEENYYFCIRSLFDQVAYEKSPKEFIQEAYFFNQRASQRANLIHK